MMNNIQQTRIQLEKTYLSMGGKELEEDAAGILTQLQTTLTRDLDQLGFKFSESITNKIDFAVKKMAALLQQVKGGGQGQAISKSEVAAAADNILGPLMDLLDGSLSMYAENCDKSVLKRLLKQLWRIVMKSLERNIVLPPIETKVCSNIYICLHFMTFNFAAKRSGERVDGTGECVWRNHWRSDRRQARCEGCHERCLCKS